MALLVLDLKLKINDQDLLLAESVLQSRFETKQSTRSNLKSSLQVRFFPLPFSIFAFPRDTGHVANCFYSFPGLVLCSTMFKVVPKWKFDGLFY